MSHEYKTILTHFDSTPHAAARLRSASTLAELFDAHVIALYSVWLGHYGLPFNTDGSALLAQELVRLQTLKDETAQRSFERTIQGLLRNPEWRSVCGDPAFIISEHSRYADLIILGQYSPHNDHDVSADFVGRVIINAGRPVLVMPDATQISTLGQRPLVAWNGSREAARAISGALPLLQRAPAVHIISLDSPEPSSHAPAHPSVEMASFLARHGVQAHVAEPSNGSGSIGERIMRHAQAIDADLIVMGGYGHSRAFEFVLGGATRAVLDAARIPVLFAH